MNRTTTRKRQQKLTADESAWDFVAARGCCDWCGRSNRVLICHEVARGGGRRDEARQSDYARLCLCDDIEPDACHKIIHRMASEDSVACGLALIYLCNSSAYDLAAYWKLMNKRWPEQETVDVWIRRLLRNNQ